MKVSPEQIEQLYRFTAQHYVEWYDLQSELVDHLANAIEARWQTEPEIAFDQALAAEFSKFGIFGFMDVVEERKKYLEKKYFRLIASYYKQFLSLPQVAIVIAAFLLVYFATMQFEDPKPFAYTLIITLSIVSVGFMLRQQHETKKRARLTGKRWLFNEIAGGINVIPFTLLPIQLANLIGGFSQDHDWTTTNYIVTSAFTVMFAVFVYIQINVLPKRIDSELAKIHPDYQPAL